MKSPHPKGWGPYQDPFPLRDVPVEEERLLTMGYRFLGWNVMTATVPEYKDCYNAAHNYRSAFPNAWHSVQHTPTGSDVTQWCALCRIYWKVDMSG